MAERQSRPQPFAPPRDDPPSDELIDEVEAAAAVIEGSPAVSDDAEAYLATLEDLTGLLLEDASLDELLTHVLELTSRAIEPSAAVSVTVVEDDGGYLTAASTNEAAVAVDQLQYELREGPCIDSLETGRVHLLCDLETEQRWPRFRERAQELGVGSVLSLPLVAGKIAIGALNVFTEERDVLSEADVELARRIAAPAAATLANARAYRRVTRLSEQLHEALLSRADIEQAKGILMARQGIDGDAAFGALRQASQRTNRKLRDVARLVVDRLAGERAQPDDRTSLGA